MQAPFKSSPGIAYPSDMTVLKQVFDRVCQENDIKCGSRAADDVARALMSLFGAGMHDETELLDSMKEFMLRNSGIIASAAEPHQANRGDLRQPTSNSRRTAFRR
ncbi:hypothetical protein [Ollibium composti]|uniref:Uncharacterized protein n=1 Tax=Ollibium composti TaxID=2675109 RepID=A0ABY2QA24_9HYPH|nr:hypothetical protein [Mesorhizobium composti]THF58552.1 hypothetical protein E6C48_08140 [Mesorhizobium composti]